MKMPILTLLVLLALPLTATALPAPLTGTAIVAQPGAPFSTYATPVAAVQVGGSLDFTNVDIFRHDVVSHEAGADDQAWCVRYGPGKCPLFWSREVGLGVTTPVLGLDRIDAGKTYTFYCTLHDGMQGTLVALPAV